MKPTYHARKRCAQRNIDEHTVEIVKKHGQKLHRTGVIFYFLRRRDIPPELRVHERYRRLEGTTLIVAEDGVVITAYRNPGALRKIRKKHKYRLVNCEEEEAGCWNRMLVAQKQWITSCPRF